MDLYIRATGAAIEAKLAELAEAARVNPNLAAHYRGTARIMEKDYAAVLTQYRSR
jgi:hypothetical protein